MTRGWDGTGRLVSDTGFQRSGVKVSGFAGRFTATVEFRARDFGGQG